MNATTSPKATVQALQCLLKERGFYPGTIDGTWSKATVAAMNAWQRKAGLRVSGTWTKRAWVVLLSSGFSRTLKYGAAAPVVRRLQRALVAATGTEQAITGVLFRSTENLIRTWQGRVGLPKNGIMNAKAWAMLKRGTYY
jgi:peptidoglycan hydrolase-like protein with peptidoglycan-binding domain